MYCSQCGSKNDDGAQFCAKCGNVITKAKLIKCNIADEIELLIEEVDLHGNQKPKGKNKEPTIEDIKIEDLSSIEIKLSDWDKKHSVESLKSEASMLLKSEEISIVEKKEDNAQLIEQLLIRLEELKFDGKRYLAPKIPEKKLEAALNSYGHNLSKESVLCLIDSTVFGGAKEGIILAKDGIYAKDLAEGATSFKFFRIKNIEIKKGIIGMKIFINGDHFINSEGLPGKDLKALFEEMKLVLSI